MESDLKDVADVEDELQEEQHPKPKVKRQAEPKAETKEKVVAESKALGNAKDQYVKTLRAASEAYKRVVEGELDKVDVGHPHYSNLKFAKIRAERILFSLDELSRGKVR